MMEFYKESKFGYLRDEDVIEELIKSSERTFIDGLGLYMKEGFKIWWDVKPDEWKKAVKYLRSWREVICSFLNESRVYSDAGYYIYRWTKKHPDAVSSIGEVDAFENQVKYATEKIKNDFESNLPYAGAVLPDKAVDLIIKASKNAPAFVRAKESDSNNIRRIRLPMLHDAVKEVMGD